MDVDRYARDCAAQLFRALISVRISNDRFEDDWPVTRDRAVLAIGDTAWTFWSDSHEHRLVGKYRLRADMRRASVRWLLFLHGDLPYRWPDLHLPGYDPATRVMTAWRDRVLRQPWHLTAPAAAAFLASGHYPVWPFLTVREYRAALANPRLLSGGRHPSP